MDHKSKLFSSFVLAVGNVANYWLMSGLSLLLKYKKKKSGYDIETKAT